MTKRLNLTIVFLLAFLFILSGSVLAVDNNTDARVYFSSQLNQNAHKIYTKLSEEFKKGSMKDGKTPIDLYNEVDQASVDSYANKSDRTLFNDFAAAKDAFDLEHPEAWYVDSSFLCLSVVKDESGHNHAIVGPGRGKTYLLDGEEIADIEGKDQALNAKIDEIVNAAGSGTGDDGTANRVKAVHDKITRSISYRFENECDRANSPFVRTTYAVVTGQGVCEGYARSFQMCLNKMNIPCVIFMGMQTSGEDPEQHMWTAVKIGQVYYTVDPTWDDPIKVKSDGEPDLSTHGTDGCEHSRYFLVGTDNTANWVPSGKVSTSPFEFQYPKISTGDYTGGTAYGSDDGLQVKYTSAAEMEGVAAGRFIVSYQGEGVHASAEKGVYLLTRMYNSHPDGTSDSFDWYYVEAGLDILEVGGGANQYFRDTPTHLIMDTPGCDYVEYALTTRKPEGYDKWLIKDDKVNPLFDPDQSVGYFKGDESEIFSQTGKLYNVNSNYEAAPYVYKQYPSSTQQVNTGEYTAKVVFDDSLNLSQDPAMKPQKPATPPGADGETSETDADPFAKYKRVPESQLHYYQKGIDIAYQCLQVNATGDRINHELQGNVKFDTDRNHQVDPDKITWLFDCNQQHPNHDWQTCRLVGVEFTFDPSALWADDTTYYQFSLENVYGSRSNKNPNSWGYLVSAPSCPYSYRSQGIDWNLWGRPSLLDNPNDIDLSHISVQGVKENDKQNLQQLQESMNLERLNGRLTLVVEDMSSKREAVDQMENLLEKQGVSEGAMMEKSLYEINFSRMCKKTLSDINDGESMRVQIGFPNGFNASSNVVFKAYHFERDDSGNIISVTEIPVIVTEYGLVVMCDSFSPFELVALDANKVDASSKTGDDELVVVGDGNTNILIDGKKAQYSTDLNVSFADGRSHTFTFEPKDPNSFQLENISFVGGDDSLTKIENTQRKEITITKEQLDAVNGSNDAGKKGTNTILSVTSIPKDAAAAQAQIGQPVQPAACAHPTIVNTNGETAKSATCTEAGLVPESRCQVCGLVLKERQVVPALGHDIAEPQIELEPTCTTEGKVKSAKCRRCHIQVEENTVIPAKGHSYDSDGKCTVCNSYSFEHDQNLNYYKDMLDTLIREINAENLEKSAYTPETWKAFSTALEKAVAKNSAQSFVESDEEVLKSLCDELKEKRAALKKAEVSGGIELIQEEPTKEEANLPQNVEPAKNVTYEIQVSGDAVLDSQDPDEAIHKGQKTFTIGHYDKETYSFIKWLVSFKPSSGMAIMASSSFKEYPSESITLNVESDLILKPVFVEKKFSTPLTLTLTPAGKGTVQFIDETFSSDTSFNVLKNDDLTLTAEPASGFKTWEMTGLTLEGTNAAKVKVKVTGENPTLKAVFNASSTPSDQKNINIKATASPTEGGTVTGGGTYTTSEKAILRASANKGYVFEGWYLDGKKVGDQPTFEVTPSKDASYTAKFVKEETQSTVTIYRLYNSHNGEHLFTPSVEEYEKLKSVGWNDEKIGWNSPSSGEAVYRLYNPGLGNHLYTKDTNEVRVLTSQHGWVSDFGGNPIFYSGGNTPIYRLYNKGLKGMHLLTKDLNEYNTLPAHGWTQEGVGLKSIN